ncbi:hypothetical protein NC651_022334 [Populus alba x Populus x berolinensis]|nr:hypothetical protein NC651_022334 [Populus alba x Populus x berolinensis]
MFDAHAYFIYRDKRELREVQLLIVEATAINSYSFVLYTSTIGFPVPEITLAANRTQGYRSLACEDLNIFAVAPISLTGSEKVQS